MEVQNVTIIDHVDTTEMNVQHKVRQNMCNSSDNWRHAYPFTQVSVIWIRLLMLTVGITCQGWISKLQGLSVTAPAGYGMCPFHASSAWIAD